MNATKYFYETQHTIICIVAMYL